MHFNPELTLDGRRPLIKEWRPQVGAVPVVGGIAHRSDIAPNKALGECWDMRHHQVMYSVVGLSGLALIALWVLWTPEGAHAEDPGFGFFYSYEQAQIGDVPQWVLVPRTLKSPMTTDTETNVRAAFKALSATKKPTYGRSAITITPADLKKGKVSRSRSTIR
jgi:hypothetical protein